jgi:hypothetical protein
MCTFDLCSHFDPQLRYKSIFKSSLNPFLILDFQNDGKKISLQQLLIHTPNLLGPRKNPPLWHKVTRFWSTTRICRMDLPGPTTSLGTRTDYSVGPWDYSPCATRHLMAWGARFTAEEYSNRKLYMSCTV